MGKTGISGVDFLEICLCARLTPPPLKHVPYSTRLQAKQTVPSSKYFMNLSYMKLALEHSQAREKEIAVKSSTE